jgi:hypothetical protein
MTAFTIYVVKFIGLKKQQYDLETSKVNYDDFFPASKLAQAIVILCLCISAFH